MKSILFVMMFTTVNAFALGPIPNGTYTGTETCSVGSFPTRMIIADDSMKWDDQVNSFEFDANSNGFFKVKSASGMTGSGLGHFTDSGLHYEIVFDFVGKDGTVHPAPGEDSLTYKQGVIHLDSTASAGPRGKISCTGDFSIAPK
jgi:hypothetical protein